MRDSQVRGRIHADDALKVDEFGAIVDLGDCQFLHHLIARGQVHQVAAAIVVVVVAKEIVKVGELGCSGRRRTRKRRLRGRSYPRHLVGAVGRTAAGA